MLNQYIFPNRKSYIDGLRGLAMLVVVFGHSLLRNPDVDSSIYFVFSSPLNVALFFTISGYLFSLKDGNQIKFLKHIFLRLVVPWLVLGLFPYVNIIHSLPRLISGETLWFMPAIIFAEIFFFYINKIAKTEIQVIAYGLFVSILGLVLYRMGWLNYAMINRAMTIQWLFVFGFILRNKEDQILEWVRMRMFILLTLFVLLGVIFILIYPGEFYDLHYNRYYFIPLTWTIIILGILIVFSLYGTWTSVPNWLVLIGQNTLIIYLLHGRLVNYLRVLLPESIVQFQATYPLYAFVETVIVCAICLVLGLLVNRYLPEVVGLKRK